MRLVFCDQVPGYVRLAVLCVRAKTCGRQGTQYYVFITAAGDIGKALRACVCVCTINTRVWPVIGQSRPQHSGDSWQILVNVACVCMCVRTVTVP